VRFVDTNLGPLITTMRHRQIQAALLLDEQRRARARGRRDVRDPRERVTTFVLKDVDVAVTAADVQSPASRVVEQIVGVADDVERRDLFSGPQCRSRALSQAFGSR
jgi:hypothetical protein